MSITNGLTIRNGELVNCREYGGVVTIPKNVISISRDAFDGCSNIRKFEVEPKNPFYIAIDGNLYTKDGKTLVHYATGKKENAFAIPKGVTSIGEKAFYRATYLTSVTIPDSVDSIGYSAFSGCSSLTGVTIPNSVKSIDTYAFASCPLLGKIIVPKSVVEMGEDVFYGYHKLAIYCEATEKPIKWHWRWNPNNRPVKWGYGQPSVKPKTETVNRYFEISNGVLKKYRGPSGDVIIPSGVTKIGYIAFIDCAYITSVTVPEGVLEIGSRAFKRCSALKSVKLPSTLKKIGNGAFYQCESLKTINIPKSVTSIGEDAFYKCTSLENIILPKYLTEVGMGAFSYCPSLTIYSESSKKPDGFHPSWKPKSRRVVWGYEGENQANVKVEKREEVKGVVNVKKAETLAPKKLTPSPLDDFKVRNGVLSAYLGKDEILVLPEEICEIDVNAFASNSKIKKVILPKTLTTIGAGAFLDCYNLEEVFIPQSVEFIGRVAFRGCEKLTIHCEQTAHQRGWDTRTHSHWNIDNRPIVWGYKLK